MSKLLSAIAVVLTCLAINVIDAPKGHAAPPTCVANFIAGLGDGCWQQTRPFTLVIQRRDNSWVSYTGNSTMFKNSAGNGASNSGSQRFSGRNQTSCVPNQDFAVGAADNHTVSVNGTTGVITITNTTWGFTNVLTPTCNGNAIMMSDSVHLYTITYATNSSVHQCPF